MSISFQLMLKTLLITCPDDSSLIGPSACFIKRQTGSPLGSNQILGVRIRLDSACSCLILVGLLTGDLKIYLHTVNRRVILSNDCEHVVLAVPGIETLAVLIRWRQDGENKVVMARFSDCLIFYPPPANNSFLKFIYYVDRWKRYIGSVCSQPKNSIQ